MPRGTPLASSSSEGERSFVRETLSFSSPSSSSPPSSSSEGVLQPEYYLRASKGGTCVDFILRIDNSLPSSPSPSLLSDPSLPPIPLYCLAPLSSPDFSLTLSLWLARDNGSPLEIIFSCINKVLLEVSLQDVSSRMGRRREVSLELFKRLPPSSPPPLVTARSYAVFGSSWISSPDKSQEVSSDCVVHFVLRGDAVCGLSISGGGVLLPETLHSLLLLSP